MKEPSGNLQSYKQIKKIQFISFKSSCIVGRAVLINCGLLKQTKKQIKIPYCQGWHIFLQITGQQDVSGPQNKMGS